MIWRYDLFNLHGEGENPRQVLVRQAIVGAFWSGRLERRF